MEKVALIIIFNHKYDKNIPVLENIYKDRFSTIFYLVPFYCGDRPDVIPVYENSIYFQGYIAQGLKSFYREEFSHYFFIGDDLLLNPVINENNYREHLNLSKSGSFLPGFTDLHKCGPWPRIREAYEFNLKPAGVEAGDELPSYQEALESLERSGLGLKELKYQQVYYNPGFKFTLGRAKNFIKWLFSSIRHRLTGKPLKLSYPITSSYADIAVVSSDNIRQFCHYCGVFAATQLHVELAIPTALALSSSEITQEKDIHLRGKPLWTPADYKELDKYDFTLHKLLTDFPEGYLYVHPIKLSKWQ